MTTVWDQMLGLSEEAQAQPRIDKKEMLKFLHEYQIDNPNDEFALVSRDGVHLGTAFNEYWTQFILKKYYGIYDGGLELI